MSLVYIHHQYNVTKMVNRCTSYNGMKSEDREWVFERGLMLSTSAYISLTVNDTHTYIRIIYMHVLYLVELEQSLVCFGGGNLPL